MSDHDDEKPATSGAQRIDKWLWYARAAKSRSLAARLVVDGSVRVNREKIRKASETVKPGDVVTVTVQHHVRVLEVKLPGARRGPATEAATLYKDLTPPPPPKEEKVISGPVRDQGAGRPTKRERRLIDRLRDRD